MSERQRECVADPSRICECLPGSVAEAHCATDAGEFYGYECTHCNGDGLCYDGSDPLGDCPDIAHRCHACNGSGRRADQTIF